MKKLLLLILCACFGFIQAQETVTLYILDGNDDAYQHFSNTVTAQEGTMFVSNEWLSMGQSYDPHRLMRIGLRYRSVPIPAGSTIESAYVQFTSYLEENDQDIVIWIRGEKNPNPLPFNSEDYNISDRLKTTASEVWGVAEWQSLIPGPNQKTHNIKRVVQELVDMEGWEENNNMVLLFHGANSGNLPKKACSWEFGGEFYSPVLEITYTAPASVEEAEIANALSIFPNPITDRFTISFTELMEGEYDISVFDLQGRKVHEMNTSILVSGDYQYDLSATELNMQTGVYLIRVHASQGEISRKVIVR